MTRHLGFFLYLGFMSATGSLGCAKPAPPKVEEEPPSAFDKVESALSAGAKFLVERQSPDGAWRSETYGSFKDGPSLTPLVVSVLQAIPDSAATQRAIDKGADYLASLVKPDGTIDPGPHGVTYPVYTAALSVIVLTKSEKEEHTKARDAWLKYLKDRQLTEELGWQPADKEYGGWGYCATLPRKPKAGESRPQLLESNLSATAFALDALEEADVPTEDPRWKKALTFVDRCQNFNADPKERDPEFDDGGFFFIYDDPVRNKAGLAGKDKKGRERFASYGSTTADGLRALLACDVHPTVDPRAFAARRWLEKNKSANNHPGKFPADREASRNAVYFYYCYSFAKVFDLIPEVEGEKGQNDWIDPLIRALLRRQKPDGSWANDLANYREDDPILATALALGALTQCQAAKEIAIISEAK
jgi:hypothetical protein